MARGDLAPARWTSRMIGSTLVAWRSALRTTATCTAVRGSRLLLGSARRNREIAGMLCDAVLNEMEKPARFLLIGVRVPPLSFLSTDGFMAGAPSRSVVLQRRQRAAISLMAWPAAGGRMADEVVR
jgi:hypothetical protein